HCCHFSRLCTTGSFTFLAAPLLTVLFENKPRPSDPVLSSTHQCIGPTLAAFLSQTALRVFSCWLVVLGQSQGRGPAGCLPIFPTLYLLLLCFPPFLF
ncbi:hypothetical protein GOODEAATRI_033933, partial [Goodea atripinnis]